MEYTEVAQFPSSSSSKVYTVKRDENGDLSCDCRGWTMKKPDKPRSCPHVRQVEAQAAFPGAQVVGMDPIQADVRPATDVVGGLLDEIEEHKGKSPDSLTEKMRRLDREA